MDESKPTETVVSKLTYQRYVTNRKRGDNMLHACVCRCLCVCVCVCVHACMCVHECMCVHAYERVHVCT